MTKQCDKTIVVNDTGALLAALPLHLPAYHVTPPETIKEIKDLESLRILENIVELKRIEILSPSSDKLKRAQGIITKLRLSSKLSITDVIVLALSLELKEKCEDSQIMIATDDYALQYAAKKSGIKFIPIRYKGIK